MDQKRIREIIDDYLAKYRPLDLKLRKNWYRYETTGDKAASEALETIELDIRKLNSDRGRFALIKKFYDGRNEIKDELLRREVEICYFRHLPNQISPDKLKRLTKLERSLQEKFNDYGPKVDGRELSPVEVDHIISDSKDSSLLEKVWKGQHLVAPILEEDFREMVALKNEIARDLGYAGALEMFAELSEFDLDMVNRFYTDLRDASELAFKELKEKFIDPRLAKRFGVSAADLMPWHYQNSFFQEAPNSIFGEVDLDRFYKGLDSNRVISQVVEFYGSIGVDISGIVKGSSLFPKPGKNPHAVAWYLNPDDPDSATLIMNLPEPPASPKAGDVSTLVHELAHDINYKSVLANKALPYLLREPTMLTEAFAMLMEKQTQTEEWFVRLGADQSAASRAASAVQLIDYADQIIFLRWSSTIYEFEKEFYSNPDQDIGELWWECRRRHQSLKRPAGWVNPDALAKYHIPNVSLLYYSNYAIGRVANVQFVDLFAKKIGRPAHGLSYFNSRELGGWLMNDFLAQGERYPWNRFLELYTGGGVSVEAWKEFYIDSDMGGRLLLL
ncbi:MAG TPA: M2 family metallopeptidase [bacterium]|nr:M2 family metallopeptidase [Myxococcales bacterium]HQG13401.1 M2 family metallopeptidase [bacterium]